MRSLIFVGFVLQPLKNGPRKKNLNENEDINAKYNFAIFCDIIIEKNMCIQKPMSFWWEI